jgi:hypothetical protein
LKLANSSRDPISKIPNTKTTDGAAQMVEHLPSKREALSSNSSNAPPQKKITEQQNKLAFHYNPKYKINMCPHWYKLFNENFKWEEEPTSLQKKHSLIPVPTLSLEVMLDLVTMNNITEEKPGKHNHNPTDQS